MQKMKRDFFVCHASEDKSNVVFPLVYALVEHGISCWVDNAEIRWGDSITQKVNEGLSISKYVLLVLSGAFVGKNWPERELNAVLNIEATTGKVRVLPLIVGDRSARSQVLRHYPLLNDKRYLVWEGDPKPVVDAALDRLGRAHDRTVYRETRSGDQKGNESLYVPKLKKSFSQRDKDEFLRDAFEVAKDYFRRALRQLEDRYAEVDTEFVAVHSERFRCSIYLHGEIKNQCIVRIGEGLAFDSIGYTEGRRMIRDGAYNELIAIVDDGFELLLKFTMGSIGRTQASDRFDPEQAAQELWKRFVTPLDH